MGAGIDTTPQFYGLGAVNCKQLGRTLKIRITAGVGLERPGVTGLDKPLVANFYSRHFTQSAITADLAVIDAEHLRDLKRSKIARDG